MGDVLGTGDATRALGISRDALQYRLRIGAIPYPSKKAGERLLWDRAELRKVAQIFARRQFKRGRKALVEKKEAARAEKFLSRRTH